MSSEEKETLRAAFKDIDVFFESSKFDSAMNDNLKYVNEVSEYIQDNILNGVDLFQHFTI